MATYTDGLKGLKVAADIEQQKALMRDVSDKKTGAEAGLVTGETALKALKAKLAAAKTAQATADTKFAGINTKWQETLSAEKDAKRSKAKKAYEEGESMITELTEKLAMYQKKGNATSAAEVQAELESMRKDFEAADKEMQAINAAEAAEQEEKEREEKIVARRKLDFAREREAGQVAEEAKGFEKEMADATN